MGWPRQTLQLGSCGMTMSTFDYILVITNKVKFIKTSQTTEKKGWAHALFYCVLVETKLKRPSHKGGKRYKPLFATFVSYLTQR